MLRNAITFLGESPGVRRAVSATGVTRAASRRFVAGETLDHFLEAARAVQDEGFGVIGNYLGESVRDAAGSRAAARAYLDLIRRLRAEGLEANVSIKLSQLGMDVSDAVLRENLDAVLEGASEGSALLRFDMESSAYTQRTLDRFEALWEAGRREIGIVLQAALHRTPGDLERMLELGASVRLCKGAYAEPSEVALQDPGRIRARFEELLPSLLERGAEPAIATHDEALIRAAIRHAHREGIPAERFEFQLLYGVRRDLQRELLDRGHRVRVYIPYGENWYPYLMRRLAERPENLFFMAHSVIRESPLGALLPGRRGLKGARR